MAEYQKESQFQLISDYFIQNPGMLLSVSYVLLTTCGIFFSDAFYEQFGINVLHMAELSDLLMAGISEPAAILVFCGGLVVAFIYEKVIQYSFGVQQRWRPKPKSLLRRIVLIMNHTPKTNVSVLSGLLLLFITYSFLFVSLYAEWRADKIKAGEGEKIAIWTEAAEQLQNRTLLGTTTNYVFLFDTEQQSTHIIPVEKVIEMSPIRDLQEESKNK